MDTTEIIFVTVGIAAIGLVLWYFLTKRASKEISLLALFKFLITN